MNRNSILVRMTDKKEFKLKLDPCDLHSIPPHPDIHSEDGETDTIKWVGANYYVSMTKGFGYNLKQG